MSRNKKWSILITVLVIIVVTILGIFVYNKYNKLKDI